MVVQYSSRWPIMFRVTLLCFSLFCLLLAPVTGYAEQAYGSGLPTPASEKAWVRAVNLRVKANLAHVYAMQRNGLRA